MASSSFNRYFQDLSMKHHCPFCSHVAISSSKLEIHKRIHTGEKPYVCNVCSRSFNQKPNLKRHYLSHTGERRFLCVSCNQKFSTKVSLKIHKCVYLSTVWKRQFVMCIFLVHIILIEISFLKLFSYGAVAFVTALDYCICILLIKYFFHCTGVNFVSVLIEYCMYLFFSQWTTCCKSL